MFGVGPMEFAILTLFCGGLAPFGIPPLPPDTAVLQAAPEKCLVYFASAGLATPDQSSANHTDQLLATAEVQTFLSQCAMQFNGALEQFGQSNPQVQPIIEIAKPLMKTLLSRPAAVYVDRLSISPGAPPTVVAGLIVNCGPRKAEVAAAVAGLEKSASAESASAPEISDATVAGVTLRRFTPAPGVEIHWGFKGDYFLATIGPGAAAELLARIGNKGTKPRWMVALEKQAAIKRVSTIRYLDVAQLIATVTPMIPNNGVDVSVVLEASGLANLTSIGGIAGFGTKGIVNRTIANFKGAPKGLFELLSGKPLTSEDLKPIPSTAVSAVALRLDLNQVYTTLTDLVEKVNPIAGQQIKQTAPAMAQGFGFRLKEDVLGAFGDVWTVHGTIVEGPSQLSGMVATVTVKNKESLLKIQNLALGMLKAQGAQLPFSITETKVGDAPAWQLVPTQSGAPSPAWAIEEGRLVVAGSLDVLKTHIGQPADNSALADLPAVASRLKTEPVLATYLDTKATVEQLIGMQRTLGPMGTALLAQQGIKFELPSLPDIKVIAPHVLPRTSTLRIAKRTLVFETFESVPLVGSVASSAPVAGVVVALLLPAVQAARQAARQNQSMNNLKMLAMSMLNEQAVHQRFPPAAICDAAGKPLLSWRVKLLPFLGEDKLYKEFNLNEPWDSEHNKPLVAKMPKVYSSPQLDDLEGKTAYLVPTGAETVFFDTQGTSLVQITDGTSKTIIIVEVDAEHAVPWTKPEDLSIAKDNPAAGLARRTPDGALAVARADGAVVTLPGDIDPATLWSFFTRAGGEATPWPGN